MEFGFFFEVEEKGGINFLKCKSANNSEPRFQGGFRKLMEVWEKSCKMASNEGGKNSESYSN